MSDVAFHFGAPDKLAYACRLLRKATASGSQVVVWVSDADCAQLDADLWAVGPTDFVSHCTATAPDAMRQRSAVELCSSWDEVAASNAGILVNLAHGFPTGFERFPRVIEVVSVDEDDRAAARDRWKRYTAQGVAIQRHDLNLRK